MTSFVLTYTFDDNLQIEHISTNYLNASASLLYDQLFRFSNALVNKIKCFGPYRQEWVKLFLDKFWTKNKLLKFVPEILHFGQHFNCTLSITNMQRGYK